MNTIIEDLHIPDRIMRHLNAPCATELHEYFDHHKSRIVLILEHVGICMGPDGQFREVEEKK